MKLWVDDIRNAPDESWTIARTVLSAIRAIKMFEFDTISLDHDISHQVSIGTKLERPFPCEETFESVAHYIEVKYRYASAIPRIVLHTSNPVGAKAMHSILINFPSVEIRPMGAANRLEQVV